MKILVAVIVFSIFISSIGFESGGIPFVYAKEDGYKEMRSEHFIINYKKDVGNSYAKKIKDTSEKYYRVITQQFNLYRNKFWTWDNRAKVFIASDKDDYLESFKCSPWSSACVDYRNKVIYTYPDQEISTPVFVHELTHIIFREYIGEGKLPLWMDEGIAVYMEDKYGKTYRNGIFVLKEHIANDTYIKFSKLNEVGVRSLNDREQDYINLFYLESFSIINFIMKKHGKHRFSNLLRRLKRGGSLEEALSKVFYDFKDLDKLEEKWKAYYRR
ncbi:MAG: hypothetical protein KAS05_00875 [Candidatus Omnitrophica bacterium]|nr:hypothetical protein [Candidatus Omnitrophota bacterium]